jgi:hypothetical protein
MAFILPSQIREDRRQLIHVMDLCVAWREPWSVIIKGGVACPQPLIRMKPPNAQHA